MIYAICDANDKWFFDHGVWMNLVNEARLWRDEEVAYDVLFLLYLDNPDGSYYVHEFDLVPTGVANYRAKETAYRKAMYCRYKPLTTEHLVEKQAELRQERFITNGKAVQLEVISKLLEERQ